MEITFVILKMYESFDFYEFLSASSHESLREITVWKIKKIGWFSFQIYKNRND